MMYVINFLNKHKNYMVIIYVKYNQHKYSRFLLFE